MASNTSLHFEIKQGDGPAQTIQLEQTPIKIGKLPSSHLRIEDPNVSRIHAVIEAARDEGFHIIDLGSQSGTFVNDVKVNKQRLSNGDVIRLGNTTVKVTFEVAEEDEGDATMVSSLDSLNQAAAGGGEVLAGGGLSAASAPAGLGMPGMGAPAPGAYGAPAPTPGGFGAPAPAGFGAPAPGGFGVPAPGQVAPSPFGLPQPGASAGPKRKRKKKKRRRPKDHFERRFLSERYRGGVGALEVALMWKGNLFHIDQYKKDAEISIGAGPTATYAVESSMVGSHRVLCRRIGGQWTLYFTKDMDGFAVTDNDEKVPLSELTTRGMATQTPEGFSIAVDGRNRFKLIIGDVVLLVHYVSLPAIAIPLIALGGAAGVSLIATLIAFGVSFMLHSGFWVLVSYTTDRVDDLAIDQLMADSAYAEALLTPEEEEEEEPEEEEEEEDQEEDRPEEEEGAKAAEEEGDVGRPDEDSLNGKFAIEGTNDNMALKKAYDTNVAMGSGLLASSTEMQSLLGTGMQAEGYDAVSAWGEFDATGAAGASHGNYGLGMSGAGRGGGGSNRGGFGVGRFGTAGRGGGGSGGRSYGKGEASLGDKAVGKPKLKPGRPDVSGSLDKRIIRKVVKQHKREIKACYEKELQKKKGLHGKIVVKWTIDVTGNVASAVVVSSTMNNTKVESCLEKAVSHWRFPAPKGGGLVVVSYPFVFEVGK